MYKYPWNYDQVDDLDSEDPAAILDVDCAKCSHLDDYRLLEEP